MFSRAPLAKQTPASKTSGKTEPAHSYFPQNEAEELRTPQFSYSLAGIRTFAEGENPEDSVHHFANRRLPFPIQTKLTVGAVNDPLEHEADRIADQVMRIPQPGARASQAGSSTARFGSATGLTSASGEFGHAAAVQRKCDCGGSCDDCKKNHSAKDDAKVQMKAAGPGVTGGFEAPVIVHDVLLSPGQPLDAQTRAFMEPRFGHDFSKVRIHTDAKAAESAGAVQAKAYTVGSNVVFGTGEYRPKTQAGQRLLGHELTHVVQQENVVPSVPSIRLGSAAPVDGSKVEGERITNGSLHRASTGTANVSARFGDGIASTTSQQTGLVLARTWNDCGEKKDCPGRQPGELDRAAAATLQVASLDAPETGEIISHFNIGSSNVTGLSGNATWKRFIALIAAEESRWEILGFSDCEGTMELNTKLRGHRAEAVLHALPKAAQTKIDRAVAAPVSDCVALNYTEWDRALNRSVVFRRTSQTITFTQETVNGARPPFVCGPDVTAQTQNAVTAIDRTFGRWNSSEKNDSCDALDSLRSGGFAWDIFDLHNNEWILSYRPPCATEHGMPPCGSSVQVGSECYYAGSVNYVIFGKMCKLCADYYLDIPLINTGYARFTKKAMVDLIDLYKGSGFSGIATPSANFDLSVAWAEAGYEGWPSGGGAPAGDRSNCKPLCPKPYSGPTFTVRWYPHQFPNR